jgi:serine/threonine protein kinase/tetratricopeptide (TPR) repeat protein
VSHLDEAAIFNTARQMEDPQARQAYLLQACGEDSQLRRRLEALLRVHDEERGFLESPTREIHALLGASADEDLDTPLGPYQLLEKLGEGGMGSVFRAEQTQPVHRHVAIKVIRPGMDSRKILDRFEAERQALALMDHPNIAKVLDAGTTPAHRPYFVMELIRGLPITQYCDEQRLSLRERLQIFVPICQAVQHAHQKGIIHRDLKPSNILIGQYDNKAVPKIIDFGIAKAIGVRLTERTLTTESGGVIGTPEYMSPEQAEPGQLDIDTRSDIYSLGVVLYELLTGTTPLRGDKRTEAGLWDLLRRIREEEPTKPSTRLSTIEGLPAIAVHRGVEPRKLAGLMRGDLDWIVMKCLEKDRTRRYATANTLARDIEHYLNEEPVEAGPPSAGYRLRKFLKRHKGPVLAAAVLLLALLAGMAGTTWGLVRAEQARNEAIAAQRAEQQRAEGERLARQQAEAAEKQAQQEKQRAVEEKQVADAVRDFLQNKLLGQADVRAQSNALLEHGGLASGANRNVTVRELLDRAAAELTPEKIEANFRNQPFLQAELLRTVGRTYFWVGETSQALALLQRAAALCQASGGPDSIQTLTALDDLGEAYRWAGKGPEAIALLEQVRAARIRKLGPDHPDTLVTLGHLAVAYHSAGKLQEAIALYEQVRAARRKHLAPDHPDALLTLSHLAGAYRAAGKLPQAIELYERVRAAELKTLGPDHPDTLITLNDLALAYLVFGKSAQALPLFEQVRDAMQKKLGPENPVTLAVLGNLAMAYRNAGRLDEAIASLEQVRTAQAKKLAPDHPQALLRLNNLALVYSEAGKLPEAIRLFEQVHELQRKRFGPDHLDTLITYDNLAVAYRRAKQLDKAIRLHKYVLQREEATLGRNHRDTLITVARLGVAYCDAGRLDEAIPLLEEAYHKSEPQAALQVGDDLQSAYLKAGKTREAAKLLAERLAAARERFPPDSPQLSSALASAGTRWLDLKNYASAEAVLRECLTLREKLAKNQQVRPWQVALVRSLLGGALLGQAKYAEAAPLLHAGYADFRQDEKAIPPQSRSLVADALSRLVDICQATGKREEAANWELVWKNLRTRSP